MKKVTVSIIMLSALVLCAGTPIKLNNTFAIDTKGRLARWFENKLAPFKPWGSYEIIDDDEGNSALHMTAKGKEYHIISNDWYDIKEGSKVVLKASVKGKGHFSIGSVVYTKDHKYIYSHYGNRSIAKEQTKEFVFRLAPKGRNGKQVGKGRIFIVAYQGADITISKFTAEKE